MGNVMECVRRIQFCAGHRVHKHESKCAHPHGHNYVAFIHATAPALDEIGRVIDFSVLKNEVGGWIDAKWDHGFIYSCEDNMMRVLFETGTSFKAYAMPYNPTAENMARYLVESICPKILDRFDIEVNKVVIWETENCYAIYSK